MGDPKKTRKSYATPGHPYQQDRLESELILVGKYGLRNKRELWIARTKLGNFRSQARKLLGLQPDNPVRVKEEANLLSRLNRIGLLTEGSDLDGVLGLTVEKLLDRRLQTFVQRKGLAFTAHQSRQMITHKHIIVGEYAVTSPGYLVLRAEEDQINFSPRSVYKDEGHPALQNPKKAKRGGRRGRDEEAFIEEKVEVEAEAEKVEVKAEKVDEKKE
ncbi:MAG: 30S ribosomal protein S4 [Candidatus Kariarchaeaceae archaeon]